MLLQPSSLYNHRVSLSSASSYSPQPPFQIFRFVLSKTRTFQNLPIACSISKVHSYGTVDFERRPLFKWNPLYKKISLMENPELGSASVLNDWETDGRKLTKRELCRIVRSLRKYRRYKQALEVYEWMNNRGERFRFSASDAAIQLDLVSKARMQEKAESLIDDMRNKGYALHPLPYNVMMTLYMNLKEYDKVESMVSEMLGKNISLDTYSYNIWLSSCGPQGSVERMEQVYEQMKEDKSVNPNWTTFSTMATMYIKMGLPEKAEECLRNVESRITGRDRIPYHYLITLYGNVGNKEEVYRVWKVYKSIFPSIPNLGYHAMVSSLVRVNDIEGAEKIYEEWLSVKTSYDARIANLLLWWYVKEGNMEKAESFFNHIADVGGKPNSSSWETLAEGHIGVARIDVALSCLKEAFVTQGSRSWRPKPTNVSAFFNLCEEKADKESRDVLMGLIKQAGYLRSATYASQIGLSRAAVEDLNNRNSSGNENEDDDSEVLLNQLQGSA